MTVLDDPLMALRIQLQQFPCPACGAHELMPRLQYDYYPDGGKSSLASCISITIRPSKENGALPGSAWVG